MDIKKICSLHLLGYKYGCDAFPPPPDVVNAPSICIPSVLKVLQPITKNRKFCPFLKQYSSFKYLEHIFFCQLLSLSRPFSALI